jgi:hypothetical protein
MKESLIKDSSNVMEAAIQRSASKVMPQHKLNFSNSPLNNSGEVIGFSGGLGESLSLDTVIGALLLKRTSVESRSFDMVSMLIGLGIKMPQLLKDGDNLLHKVARCCQSDLVKHLLDLGYDPNGEGVCSENPLHRAAKADCMKAAHYCNLPALR